jgi:hypothetical protein
LPWFSEQEQFSTADLFFVLQELTFSTYARFISHQPALLFSHNKPATSNQPTVLFSHNKPSPAICHQPNEQTICLSMQHYHAIIYI